MEGMDAVVSALVAAAVVDSAACHNPYICTILHIEIVVYKVCHARFAEYYRDIDSLSIRLAINININAGLVRLFLYLDVLAVSVAD